MSKVGEISITVFQTPNIPDREVGQGRELLHTLTVLGQCRLQDVWDLKTFFFSP